MVPKIFTNEQKPIKMVGHNRGSMQLSKFRTVPRLMLCQLNIQTSCISASGGQKRIWREIAATSNRKLHANEISQKTLFLIIVQAISYNPKETEEAEYFVNWCRNQSESEFEIDGRNVRLAGTGPKNKRYYI